MPTSRRRAARSRAKRQTRRPVTNQESRGSRMAITVKAYANADDVLIAWEPDPWSSDWVGFKVERRDDATKQVTELVNRIPPKAGDGPVQPTGVPSSQSPIRRCIWT